VRLDLVGRIQRQGQHDVATYFHNYSGMRDWHLAVGLVDGRPAVLVYDIAPSSPSSTYFVLLEWDGERISGIRDFRYARYAASEASMVATN